MSDNTFTPRARALLSELKEVDAGTSIGLHDGGVIMSQQGPSWNELPGTIEKVTDTGVWMTAHGERVFVPIVDDHWKFFSVKTRISTITA